MCRARLNFAGALTMYGRWEESTKISLECYRLASRFGAMRTYGRVGLGNAAEALIFLLIVSHNQLISLAFLTC